MEINKNAPVRAAGEIEIAAAPELVWEVMTDIAHWPNWNGDVKWAAIDGALAKGTSFRWKAGPGTIKSTLQSVEPNRQVAWTGTTMGIDAIHVWNLAPHSGHTLVRTEESWEGLIVTLFKSSMQKSLEKAITAGLHFLKNEVERKTKLV